MNTPLTQYTYLSGDLPLELLTTDFEGVPLTASKGYVTIFKQTSAPSSSSLVLARTDAGVIVEPGRVVYVVSSPYTDTAGDYLAILEAIINATDIRKREIPFQVLDRPRYSRIERMLMDALSLYLRDNKPYLYRVDPQIPHYDDEELYAFLFYALWDFNSSSPFWTDYTFESLPEQAYNVVIMGGQVMALIARGILEAERHFSYNDNGISVTIQRSSAFMSPATALLSTYVRLKVSMKRNIAFRSTKFRGLKTQRAPISIRRPLSMIPNLETVFGRDGGA